MKIAREAVMAMKAKAAASRVKRLRPEIGASVPAFMRIVTEFEGGGCNSVSMDQL